MSDRIPAELLIDILTRLTVKDLVRFTVVCKSWRSLIASPNFISLHSARIAESGNDLLLVRTYSKGEWREESGTEQYSIHLDDDTFGVYKRLDFPFKCYNPCFRVIGCVNGVVCLSDDLVGYYHVIILWNPSIRRYVSLPEPIANYRSHGPYRQAFGFGFNATTGGYKVVRLVYLEGCSGRKVPPEVEVYDMSEEGSWRIVESKGFSYVVDHKSQAAFLNGAIHWVGIKVKNKPTAFVAVVTFDLENEVLGMIDVPDVLAEMEMPVISHVAVVGESLSLIHNAQPWDRICSIWVMERYGAPETWTKRYTIARPMCSWDIFCFPKNRDFSVSRKLWKSHIGSGVLEGGEYLCVEKFVESLSLLGVERELANNLPSDRLKGSSVPEEDEDQSQ